MPDAAVVAAVTEASREHLDALRDENLAIARASGSAYDELAYVEAVRAMRATAFSRLVFCDELFEFACQVKLKHSPPIPLTAEEIVSGLDTTYIHHQKDEAEMLRVFRLVLPHLDGSISEYDELYEHLVFFATTLLDRLDQSERAITASCIARLGKATFGDLNAAEIGVDEPDERRQGVFACGTPSAGLRVLQEIRALETRHT